MRRLAVKRIVALGLFVLGLSCGALAVVEIMGPAHNRETLNAHAVLIRQRVFGEISAKEAANRCAQLPTVGISGYFLTRHGYAVYRTLALGGALAGLALIAAGVIRAPQRSIATPPGS